MRMLYVGSLSSMPDRDSGWIRAFTDLGLEVQAFSSRYPVAGIPFLSKVQRRLHIGSGNKKMQADLLAMVTDWKPKWVHFRMPIEFDLGTIDKIRSLGIIVTEYFNDDPFSPKAVPLLHRKFKKSIPLYDAHFVYRAHNLDDYYKAGAKHVEHCPPTFNPEIHKFQMRSSTSSYLWDAAFIGHWENDERCDYLDALMLAGFNVAVRGGMWEKALKNRPIEQLAPISGAFGDEYNDIYANAIAGLCFFSKINRDTWTERALEIVAVGGVLVCERTDEAMSYFEDRKEALFFSSIGECVEIVSTLKNDSGLRERIRAAGYRRLMNGQNTIFERAKQMERFVCNIIKNNA